MAQETVTPANTASCRMFIYGENTAVGLQIRYRRALIVAKADYDAGYFDGDTPGATWDGTPHASTSRRTYRVV